MSNAHRSFNRFCSLTGIRAFGFASHSKSTTESAFWYGLLIMGTVLTCMDVVSTFQSYRNFPTSTKISLSNNQTLELPGTTLCIFVTVPEFSLNDSYLHELLSKFDSSSSLSVNATKFVNSTDSYVKYLDLLSQLVADTVLVEQGVWGSFKNETINAESILPLFKYSSYMMPIINRHVDAMGLSLLDVAKFVGSYICRRMSVKLQFYDVTGDEDNYGTKFDVCQPKYINWIGVTPHNKDVPSLCLALPDGFLTFMTNQDSATIKWNDPDVDDADIADSEYFVALEFFGGRVHLQSSENVLWMPLYKGLNVAISVFGQYEKINQPRSPCSNEVRSECLLRCRLEYIQTHCGCRPMFGDSENQTIPICGTYQLPNRLSNNDNPFVPGYNLHNAACHLIKVKSLPDPNCELQCNPPCSSTILSFSYIPGKSTESRSGTRLCLFVERFKFHKASEIPLISFKQFLGSLGGNLSLYLGASFIVLIHTVVFWLSELVDQLLSDNRGLTVTTQ